MREHCRKRDAAHDVRGHRPAVVPHELIRVVRGHTRVEEGEVRRRNADAVDANVLHRWV